jgi:hypothetical protein
MNQSGVVKKKLESGSRINIWKQDPTVRELGVRTTFVHNKVYAGPSDSQIAIKGFTPILPDINGDFLFAPPEQRVVEDLYNLPAISEEEQRFDAAHTYAVVRKVLTMYQRVLGRELKWVWNSEGDVEPLSIYPHANVGRSAFYDRSLKSLNFQYFYVLGKQPVFTCRSMDVVSHETGHAIFDSLKPYWNALEDGRGLSLAIAALQESLSDLTSIFLILSQLDLVEYIIAQTKANLRYEDNILATWGEELGVIPGYGAVRNAVNNLKLSEAGTEIHRISQVFTGAVYDMLSEILNAEREPDIRDDAEALYQVSQYMLHVLVQSVLLSPDRKASFADVANEMIKITEGSGRSGHAEIIRNNFIYRDILTDTGVASPLDDFSEIFPDLRGCCGTLNGTAVSK